MKIVSARITAQPKGMFDPMPEVHVTTADGQEHFLFWYYPDELSFSESEFIGLDLASAIDLKRQKDLAYLKS